jgi:hypothetical protein
MRSTSSFDDLKTDVMKDDLLQALTERARRRDASVSFDDEETDVRTTVARRSPLQAPPAEPPPELRLVAPVAPVEPKASDERPAPRRPRRRSARPSLRRGVMAVLAAAALGAGIGAIVPRPSERHAQPAADEPALLRLPELMPTTALGWANVPSPPPAAAAPNAARAVAASPLVR